jgi:CheY-like chemotaxis protein
VLRQLEMEMYDLILMDVQMPVMDGLEATRRIRGHAGSAFDPRIPIVALTAYTEMEDRKNYLEAGMDGFVAKPVDADALLEEIGRLTT